MNSENREFDGVKVLQITEGEATEHYKWKMNLHLW
jgi:hypothetical protein